MTDTIQVGGTTTAALLVAAGDGPTLVSNIDSTNTLYVGDDDAIRATDSTGVVAIAPGGQLSVAGTQDLFGIAASGKTVNVTVISGGTSFFQPPNLAGIGGASVFNQATAPPVTAPNNSLWFKTDGSLWQLESGVWTEIQFNAQNIIEASTIVSSLILAGTIVAGIVNSTEIDGALLRIKNSSGATTMTINKSAGTWIQYLDTGSATQGAIIASSSNAALTDEFGNAVLAGVVNYFTISAGSFQAVQINQGFINFLNSSSLAGPWNVYTSLEPDTTTGLLAYFDNAGNYFALGTAFVHTTATINITTTTPVVIVSYPNIEAISYKFRIHIVWLGGGTAATAVIGLDGSATVSNMLGTLAHARGSTLSFSNVGIVNQNSAIGNQSYPFNAGELETYEFEGIITFSAGGTFNVRGQCGTAGDSFAIATFSYMELSPLQ